MTATSEPVFERLWHELRHPHHDGHLAASHHNPQGETMLTIRQIHDAIDDGIGNIEGWAEDLKAKLPAIAARAAQIDSSPIVQALEGIVLPPEIEAEFAALIAKVGAKFPAPAAAAPAAPAESETVAAQPA